MIGSESIVLVRLSMLMSSLSVLLSVAVCAGSHETSQSDTSNIAASKLDTLEEIIR